MRQNSAPHPGEASPRNRRPIARRRGIPIALALCAGMLGGSLPFVPIGLDAASAKAQAACQGPQRDVSLPLPDLGNAPYVRMDGQVTEYTGGLYPGGANTRPPEHEAAGLAIASQIVPLDPDGTPDPTNGRIVMISIGMSNTQMDFQTLMDMAHSDPEINPRLTLVNGALGGRTADFWVDPASMTWDQVDIALGRADVSPLQVQVAWVKQTLVQGGEFPGKALELQDALEAIVHNLLSHYPNLRIVFLSSRTRSFTYDRGLSPEPVAFETGFAVKWLIEAQINGDPDLNYDPARGEVRAPFLSWGPYLWIDGPNPRSDGLTWTPEDLAEDCTHPSSTGLDKVGRMMLDFFTADALAIPWFLEHAALPTATSTATPTLSPSPTLAATPTIALPPTVSESEAEATPSPTPVAGDAGGGLGSLVALALVIVAGGGAAVLYLLRKRA